eukprot:2376506-Amphidinium_carterae.1
MFWHVRGLSFLLALFLHVWELSGRPALQSVLAMGYYMYVFKNFEGGAYSDFDSTLGYPGEGPCSLCGESGHNILTCPIMLYEEPPSKVSKKSKPQGSSTSAGAPQSSMIPVVPTAVTVLPATPVSGQAASSGSGVVGVPATPVTGRVTGGLSVGGLDVDVGEAVVCQPCPGTPGMSRVYCPVVGCSKNCPQFAAGWTNTQAMRPHLEEHIQGRLQGSIPEEFLTGNSLSICQVCSKLIAT